MLSPVLRYPVGHSTRKNWPIRGQHTPRIEYPEVLFLLPKTEARFGSETGCPTRRRTWLRLQQNTEGMGIRTIRGWGDSLGETPSPAGRYPFFRVRRKILRLIFSIYELFTAPARIAHPQISEMPTPVHQIEYRHCTRHRHSRQGRPGLITLVPLTRDHLPPSRTHSSGVF
jgi:hypothetical protein